MSINLYDSKIRDWMKSQVRERIEMRLANESDPNRRRIILEFLDQELITEEGLDWLKQEIANPNY